MKDTERFDARAVRDALLARGGPDTAGFVKHAYRPFDNRWLYWESETKLLREKSPRYPAHVFDGNLWLSAAQHLRRGADEPQACFAEYIASRHLIERGTSMFPAWLRDDGIGNDERSARRPNLSGPAQRYLDLLGTNVDDLFHYVLAVLHDPAYRGANAGGLRMGWPRIPLPGWPDRGADGAAEALAESAARGRELATLLDPDASVPDVTQGPLHPEFAIIAVPSTIEESNMSGEDFAVTAGWGRFGKGDAVMPSQGHAIERPRAPNEIVALGNAFPTLSETTFDIYLNDNAFWRNVPASVWNYKLGGYQVLKKWLSYRESGILNRRLSPMEVQHFTDTARRITAILRLSNETASTR